MTGGSKPRKKGDRFEREVKKYLNNKGFFCVRQPRSAFPDLIAIRNEKVYWIECKVRKYISTEERNMLNTLTANYGGHAFIAYKQKTIKFCNPQNYEQIDHKFF